MPLYRGVIYKRLDALNGERWTNTYHIESGIGPNDALNSLETIANAEMAVSIGAVHVYRLTVKNILIGDTVQRGVDIPGGRTVDPVNMIPFFNTVRVVFTDDVGKAESKYLRGVIGEINVEGFNISGELKNSVQSDYADAVLGVLGVRGPNGETLTGANVQQLIQMRQIGWHRRTRAGFKRGWVPV